MILTGLAKNRLRFFDMSKLLILGAGQYGKVAYEIAKAMERFERISFLDDNSSVAIGKLNDFDKYIGEYNSAVVALGNVEMRLKVIEQLENAGYDIPVLISPRAYVAPSAVIGKGSFVEPMTVVHTEAVIGIGCIISAGAVVNHNAIVGDGCHIDCGSIIGARVNTPRYITTKYGEIITQN